MRFHANHVSSSISGDYYQAMFEAEEDTNTWFNHGLYLNGAIYGGHNTYESSRSSCQTQSYLRIGQRYLRMTQNPL